MSKYWLLKTEPKTYSFDQLIRDGKTNWDGIRNYQARNFMKEISAGDLALIYHSGDVKAVVGIAKVVREAYPDPDLENPGDWVQVDLEPIKPLEKAIRLTDIKNNSSLSDLLLIKQSRLSVMPVDAKHFDTLLKLSTSNKDEE
jgi:predicted RNA-binding protein with PUA-like domain